MSPPLVRVAACAVLALALGGCLSLGGTPAQTRLFVLEAAPAAAEKVSRLDSSRGLSVGVGPLSVPEYAGSRLVTRVGPNEVRRSEVDRWAEPLAGGLQRVLITNLATLLGSERVVAHPWRPELRPEWRIEIEVLRFERSAEGAADLEARWNVRRSADLALLRSGTTRLVRAPASPGSEALVAALSQSVAEWSVELAAALREAASSAP